MDDGLFVDDDFGDDFDDDFENDEVASAKKEDIFNNSENKEKKLL